MKLFLQVIRTIWLRISHHPKTSSAIRCQGIKEVRRGDTNWLLIYLCRLNYHDRVSTNLLRKQRGLGIRRFSMCQVSQREKRIFTHCPKSRLLSIRKRSMSPSQIHRTTCNHQVLPPDTVSSENLINKNLKVQHLRAGICLIFKSIPKRTFMTMIRRLGNQNIKRDYHLNRQKSAHVPHSNGIYRSRPQKLLTLR